jgi:hypothetical protein
VKSSSELANQHRKWILKVMGFEAQGLKQTKKPPSQNSIQN